MTLPRPNSRWRSSTGPLMLAAAILWAMGVMLSVVNEDGYAGWFSIGLVGALVAGVTWLAVRRPERRYWGLVVGAGLALAGVANIGSLMGAVLVVIVVVSIVGTRRGMLAVGVIFGLQVARMMWATVALRGFRVDAGIVDEISIAGLLALGCYIGGLIHRAETTADELWLAHRQLEAQAATQRELVLAEERTRAAQEMHDGLGHQLTLIRMSLEFAERMRERDPGTAWAEVHEAAETNARALADMRAWVRAMAPPSAALGVGHMLETLAASFRGTGLDVAVSYAGPEGELPQAVALFVNRVVQESLTNVLKHSNATRVTLDAVRGDGGLQMVVADNGTVETDGPVGEGFGLRSLRERAEALGGELGYSRRPADGFRIEARVPLDWLPVGTWPAPGGAHADVPAEELVA